MPEAASSALSGNLDLPKIEIISKGSVVTVTRHQRRLDILRQNSVINYFHSFVRAYPY